MANLTIKQRIEILISLGCGDLTRSQREVCDMFNAKYPNRPITQSTVSKIQKKFRDTGDVKDISKSGRPQISDDKKVDILLQLEENPHYPSLKLVAGNSKLKHLIRKVIAF